VAFFILYKHWAFYEDFQRKQSRFRTKVLGRLCLGYKKKRAFFVLRSACTIFAVELRKRAATDKKREKRNTK
jgi:hypothetical protein